MHALPNILPYDGEVLYYENILSQPEADKYFNCLLQNIQWKHDEVMMFGKKIITKRETAWYGDADLAYTYSGVKRQPIPWTNLLQELKSIVEDATKETFNSCLLNLYHNGEEGMNWHSDDEKDLKPNGAIASLSLGAERKFSFKHKTTGERRSLILGHGSMVLMKGTVQTHWLHSIPKTKKVITPRINLTYRTII